MTTSMARLAVTLLVAAGLPLLASSPAQAAACTRGTGVTVVVDGNQLGGLSTTCVGGSGRSAVSAFQAAGVGMDRVVSQPGFVCKVNGLPASQKCQRPAPATAYWSLWVSDGKGTWTYASRGVDAQTVPTGGWVAWSWQGQSARSAPSVTPQGPAPATKPPKKSGSSSGSGSSGGSVGGSTGSSDGASTSPRPSATRSADGAPRATTSRDGGERSSRGEASKDSSGNTDRDGARSTGDGATNGTETTGPGDGSGDGSGEVSDDQVAPTASSTDGGGLGPWVAGLAIVGVLAAAGATAWRRRQTR